MLDKQFYEGLLHISYICFACDGLVKIKEQVSMKLNVK